MPSWSPLNNDLLKLRHTFFSLLKPSYGHRYELDDDLQYRRQLLNLRVRSVARRLADDLQRVRNALNEGDHLEIVILVIACKRFEALKEHLESLQNLQGPKIPIVVSLDCNDDAIRNLVLSAGPNVTLIENPDQSSFNLTKHERKYEGYYRIARHYHFALDYVFSILRYQSAIITEEKPVSLLDGTQSIYCLQLSDDLLLAPDFLEYMLASRKLLFEDPTIWCISAWNDNGKKELIVKNNSLLHRTDFFPGLGWMLTSHLWEELKVKWPKTFWDDWMRDPAQRQGRACIRPEISRTGISLRGKKGVSKGMYYEKYLKHIMVNTDFYHFSRSDLSYLKKDYYDPAFRKNIIGAVPATLDEILRGRFQNNTILPEKVRLSYVGSADFKAFARRFNVMDDFRVCLRDLNFLFSVASRIREFTLAMHEVNLAVI
uniref:Alpha-1,3-mannosyl-glycoprotein 2-beta-N-acetylglucosaminyltransferase n=1 Tax=Elaeophora elaphi TaxID=1147741 RepID=A0A0R3RG53_9BILA